MENFFRGFNFPMQMPGPFTVQLRAYSPGFNDSADAEKVMEINYGGKIYLPNSALDHLIRLNIQYPMLFKLSNPRVDSQRVTHCGVLEFSAPEGRCYLPSWMMHQLNLEEGDVVRVDSASLPKATFARLKPQSVEFLNITNPRAVLEVELRKFACLTKNDRIAVRYADILLEFLVVDLEPKKAVCIIECDLNLEFDAPEGYVEEDNASKDYTVKPAAPPGLAAAAAALPQPTNQFTAFSGSGVRLDGKKKPSSNSITVDSPAELDTFVIVPNEDYKPGKLSFVRYDYKSRVVLEKEAKEREEASKKIAQTFQGSTGTIRKGRY